MLPSILIHTLAPSPHQRPVSVSPSSLAMRSGGETLIKSVQRIPRLIGTACTLVLLNGWPQSAQAIGGIGAQPVPPGQFEGVLQTGCTAVAISAQDLLTAAHCAPTLNAPLFSLNGQLFSAKQVIINPGYSFPDNDLAIIHLDQNLPANIPFYPIWNQPFQGSNELTFVGFGGGSKTFGSNRPDVSIAYELDSQGQRVLNNQGQPNLFLIPTDIATQPGALPGSSGPILTEFFAFDYDDSPYASYSPADPTLPNATSSEITFLGGDSGGAAFTFQNNAYYLAGINTFVSNATDTNNTAYQFGGGMALYAYEPWIQSNRAVPTPALLPGVIGLGVSLWRNQRRKTNG